MKTRRGQLMVVVSSLTLVVALLPVAGSFAETVSFAPATHFPLGSNPSSVAIGDLNGDGKPKEAQARMVADYGRIPLHFESNQGQADGKVKFLTRGSGYSMFFTPTEMVLSLASGSPQTTQPTPRRLRAFVPFSGRSADPGVDPFDPSGPKRAARETQHATLRMKLLRATPDPKVIGEKELPGKVNYFIGNDPKQWRSNVATYATVKYERVYPGIDLLHYGNQRQLEFDFVVAPGADPTRIAFAFAGAEKMELNDAGDLVLHTSAGDVTQHKPIVYQEVDGERKHVEGRYALSPQPALSGTEGSLALRPVSFEVGAYDHDRPLVIDPVLSYSTFLGGSSYDDGGHIAVDAAGNAYVTGATASSDFPTTSGAFQTTNSGGSSDAFVTKLNPAGSALVYSTYLGGSGGQKGAYGIAVDAAGNAYVGGFTRSADFPTTSGAFQTTFSGDYDVFVTKLNPAGSALVYSTFLGGSSYDDGGHIAVDAAGNAYVTGVTASTDFPTTSGAFQTTFGGVADVFVTKLNPAGSALVYSTFLGGSSADYGYGIALDAAGNAYVTGRTYSTDFPTTPGAFQPTYGGGEAHAFVTKIGINVPPAEADQNLINTINSMTLPASSKTSLTAPLISALNRLSDDNPTNDIAACNDLGAFINQVSAKQKAGKLTAEQAAELTSAAQAIQGALECP